MKEFLILAMIWGFVIPWEPIPDHPPETICEIERRTSSSGWNMIAEVPEFLGCFVDDSVFPGQSFFYRMRTRVGDPDSADVQYSDYANSVGGYIWAWTDSIPEAYLGIFEPDSFLVILALPHVDGCAWITESGPSGLPGFIWIYAECQGCDGSRARGWAVLRSRAPE